MSPGQRRTSCAVMRLARSGSVPNDGRLCKSGSELPERYGWCELYDIAHDTALCHTIPYCTASYRTIYHTIPYRILSCPHRTVPYHRMRSHPIIRSDQGQGASHIVTFGTVSYHTVTTLPRCLPYGSPVQCHIVPYRTEPHRIVPHLIQVIAF